MKSIREVTMAIRNRLGNIVNWPISEAENRPIVRRFTQKAKPYGFPMTVGTVDGTLIRIIVPKLQVSVYKSRYQNTALNVCAVTDCGLFNFHLH